MNSTSLFSLPAFVIYLNTTVAGLLFSLLIPTLSLFVAEELDANAFWVGFFFVATSLSSIGIAHLLGGWSDRLTDRRGLIALGSTAGALAGFGFMALRDYWWCLAVSVTCYSTAFACIAQIFAHARDYADASYDRKQKVMFNSVVRACAAFAWVAGPPLGFLSLKVNGFTSHYLGLGVLFSLGAIASYLILPRVQALTAKAAPLRLPGHARTMLLAVAAFALLFGCNQAYLIALPLYLTQIQQVDASWAGWIMGTAAALEVPVMLAAGWLGARFALPKLILVGAIAPIVLYLGVWGANDIWQLFPLQFCNALLVGFIAGLGLTWFQDLMPGQSGSASSLFWNTNSLGNIIGAGTIAVFAAWLGYRHVYLVNASMALAAALLLLAVIRLEREAPDGSSEKGI